MAKPKNGVSAKPKKQSNREYRAKNKGSIKCSAKCKEPRMEGSRYCAVHDAQRKSENMARWHRVNAPNHTCETCGRSWIGTVECLDCRTKPTPINPCHKCGKENDTDADHCTRCNNMEKDAQRRRTKERVAQGRCPRCGDEPCTEWTDMGEMCLLNQMAYRTWGTNTKGKLLREMLERQNYLCPYLGEPLEIGRNASLDHKLAKSRGGTDDIDNLQFVDLWVNLSKNDGTDDYFYEKATLLVERLYGISIDRSLRRKIS